MRGGAAFQFGGRRPLHVGWEAELRLRTGGEVRLGDHSGSACKGHCTAPQGLNMVSVRCGDRGDCL